MVSFLAFNLDEWDLEAVVERSRYRVISILGVVGISNKVKKDFQRKSKDI